MDADSGVVVDRGSAPHPEGTSVDPVAWVDALHLAWEDAGVDRHDVVGVGVFAQQHGLVALDEADRPVRNALLWNDLRSAPQSASMREELGVERWIRTVGIAPDPSITLTKLAWLRAHEPKRASRVERVLLPHDWLTMALTGEFVTDRSDASGTGYFDGATSTYRPELLERFFGAVPDLPEVLGPNEAAGQLRGPWRTAAGAPVTVSAGGGDNAGAALGLAAAPGDVIISVGTSGTVFGPSVEPVVDASGVTARFADATGMHLPLLCTLNAARIMSSVAGLIGVDLESFNRLALSGPSDCAGLNLLPYFDGERTPALQLATGTLSGLTRDSLTPENLARATVLSIANSLADCLSRLRSVGLPTDRVLLIGGGSRSAALRSVLPDTLDLPVVVPMGEEYVALGAARQAAWSATGELPSWSPTIETEVLPRSDEGIRAYRQRYGEHRRTLYGN